MAGEELRIVWLLLGMVGLVLGLQKVFAPPRHYRMFPLWFVRLMGVFSIIFGLAALYGAFFGY